MARAETALAASPIVVIQHKARFGEIEARGVALTRDGEAAYNAYGIESEADPAARQAKVEEFTRNYPRTHRQLHDAGWAYYTYQATDAGRLRRAPGVPARRADVKTLLDAGDAALVPQTYHDFLPFSAAAIFRANMTEGTRGTSDVGQDASDNRRRLEAAMGTAIADRHDLHRRDRDESFRRVCAELNLLPPD